MGLTMGGGGQQSSQGYNYGQSLSQSLQQIWGPQAKQLENMYGGVGNLMKQQAATIGQTANRQNAQVMPAARAGLSQMQQFANPNSGLARRQLADYSQQVGQDFARNILPQIQSQAGLAGGMGGSRAALAQGVAAGDAARAIAQGGTDIYSHQYDTAAQAAQLLPQMASQVYNLGMGPSSALWAPYTSAAGIFGGPTALTTAQSQQIGEGWTGSQGKQGKSFGFQLF